MSRHYFDCEHEGQTVRVVLGYDRPLDEFFLQVYRTGFAAGDSFREQLCDEADFLYASMSDYDAPPDDLTYFRSQLKRLGINAPESLFKAVEADAARRTGNLVMVHFADGTTRQLYCPRD
jgi:hypothetical protein